jgi:signal transduction histidine kinase
MTRIVVTMMRSGCSGGRLLGMNSEAIVSPRWRFKWPGRDALLPLTVGVVAQVEVWAPYGLGNPVGPRPAMAVVYALTSAALFWRRRAPLAVLAFVLTLNAAQDLAFGAPEGLGPFLPVLFAFYAVGRYASTGSVVLAAPLVALGTAVHELKDPQFALTGSTAAFWVILAAAWPLGHAFRRRAHDAARLAERATSLERERGQLAREAVADERARIARELHDVVGHAVSVVVLQLVAALELLDAGDASAARVRLLGSERSARQALAEMRRLLGLLDEGETEPPLAPQPGLRELDQLLGDTRAAGAEVDLAVEGQPREVPGGVDLAAFRILQESLTNVLKHARPPRALVRIDYQSDAIAIQVLDQGLDANHATNAGRGLTGMRERVILYGGQLEVGTRPEGGFAVRARLPIEQ